MKTDRIDVFGFHYIVASALGAYWGTALINFSCPKCGAYARVILVRVNMQILGGRTRCIMGDVQMANNSACIFCVLRLYILIIKAEIEPPPKI